MTNRVTRNNEWSDSHVCELYIQFCWYDQKILTDCQLWHQGQHHFQLAQYLAIHLIYSAAGFAYLLHITFHVWDWKLPFMCPSAYPSKWLCNWGLISLIPSVQLVLFNVHTCMSTLTDIALLIAKRLRWTWLATVMVLKWHYAESCQFLWLAVE